jgi:hypothetical protein
MRWICRWRSAVWFRGRCAGLGVGLGTGGGRRGRGQNACTQGQTGSFGNLHRLTAVSRLWVTRVLLVWRRGGWGGGRRIWRGLFFRRRFLWGGGF